MEVERLVAHGQARIGVPTGAMVKRETRWMIVDAKGKELLILDKLRADHSKPVKAWAAERQDKIELFCLPRYGPQLNPEKRLNGDLKQTIGANACAHQGRVEISSHRTHVSDDVCFTCRGGGIRQWP